MPGPTKSGSQNQVLPSRPATIDLKDDVSSKEAVKSIEVERMNSCNTDSGYGSDADSPFISERSVRNFDAESTSVSDSGMESLQDDVSEFSDLSEGAVEVPESDSPRLDETSSSPASKKTYRIKPDIEQKIPEPALSLLREKVENQNYRNPYYVEEVPDSPQDNVLAKSSIFEEPLFAESRTSEADQMSPISEISSDEESDVSVSRAASNIEKIKLENKKELETVIQSVFEKTSLYFPEFAHYVNINLASSLRNFSAGGVIQDCENLTNALLFFARALENRISQEEYEFNRRCQNMSPDERLMNDDALQSEACDLDKKRSLVKVYLGMADLVEDYLNNQIVDECKHKLRKAFSSFQNPSEESFNRARAQLGVDVSLLSIDGGFEISSQVVGCNDTKIRTFSNKKFTLRITAGIDFFKGYVSGVKGVIDGKVFKNLEAFVDYYSDSMLLALHKPLPGQGVKRAVFNNKQAERHKKKLVRSIPDLEENLKALGILVPGQATIEYKPEDKSVPLKIKRSVLEAQMGARLCKVVGLDRKATKWDNTFTKKAPLLDQLKKHPEWLRLYDDHCLNVIITPELNDYCDRLRTCLPEDIQPSVVHKQDSACSAYQGKDIIPAIGRRLTMLEDIMSHSGKTLTDGTGTALQKAPGELAMVSDYLKHCLQSNYGEYKEYCRLVNQAKNNPGNRQARAFKAAMKAYRGARSTPEMLKMMLVTHAQLLHLLERTQQAMEVNISEPTREWLEQMELDMTVPDVVLSKKEREQHLMLKMQSKGSIRFNDSIVKVAAGPFQGLADVRFIKKRNEPNPDSDGDYLYIALRGSFVGTASVLEGSIEAVITKLFGSLPTVDGEAPTLIDPLSSTDFVLQGQKHLKMELFFVKGVDKKYHLQYKRRLTGKEASVKGGVKVPVSGGANVSGQLAVDRYDYHFLGEVLGDNTMTYVMTRYNGWAAGGKPERWQAFLTDPENQGPLAQIMINMATDGENAHMEFQDILSSMETWYEERSNNQRLSEEEKASAKHILQQMKLWPDAFEKLKRYFDMNRPSSLYFRRQAWVDGLRKQLKSTLVEIDHESPSTILANLKQLRAQSADLIARKEDVVAGGTTEMGGTGGIDRQDSSLEQIIGIRGMLDELIHDLENLDKGATRPKEKMIKSAVKKASSAADQVSLLFREVSHDSSVKHACLRTAKSLHFTKARGMLVEMLKAYYPIYLEDMNGRFHEVPPDSKSQ